MSTQLLNNLPENYSVPVPLKIDDFKKIVSVPSTDIILLITDHIYGNDLQYIVILKPAGFDNVYPCIALHKNNYIQNKIIRS